MLDKHLEVLFKCQEQKAFANFSVIKNESKLLLNLPEQNIKNKNKKWLTLLLDMKLEMMESNKLLQEVESLEKSIVSKILYIYAFAKISNFSKVRVEIEKITRTDPKEIILEFNGLDLTSEQKKQVIQRLELLLDTIRKLIHHELFETLALTLSHIWPENLKIDFEKKYEIDFSKATLREKINSPNYGVLAPAAWLPTLLKRGSQIEINEYLKKVIEMFTHYSFKDCLWIFEFYLPQDLKYREMIRKEIEKLSQNTDLYSFELLNILLKSPAINSLFDKQQAKKININFQIRRATYLKFINEPKFANFSIFNLLILGDQDIKYADKIE